MILGTDNLRVAAEGGGRQLESRGVRREPGRQEKEILTVGSRIEDRGGRCINVLTLESLGIRVRPGEVGSGAWVSWVWGSHMSVWGDWRRKGYWVPGIVEIGVGLGLDHPARDAGNLMLRIV